MATWLGVAAWYLERIGIIAGDMFLLTATCCVGVHCNISCS